MILILIVAVALYFGFLALVAHDQIYGPTHGPQHF